MCCMQSRCARLPRAHAHSISPRSRSFAGYFQSEEGRLSCIHCDSLGDYYQELPAQSGCQFLSAQHAAIHRSAQRGQQKCVPVQGRCDLCHQSAVACMPSYLRAWVSTGPPTAGYHNARLDAGEVRCSRHRSFLCAASYEYTARFRVCRSVRNVRGRKGLRRLRRRLPHALCLPCVESAMCARAGPVGVSCPGRLSPPFRDSGCASPSFLARTSLGQTFDETTRRLQRFGWLFCCRRLTLGPN